MSNIGRTTSGPLEDPAHATWSRAGIWRFVAEPLIALALLVAGMWNLGGRAVWWDEGWTLSVAQNWVQRGHYGRLLDGQLAAPGLQAAFPVTAPIALFMRLFGAGIRQGRVFGVLCMVAAFACIYYLALTILLAGSFAVSALVPWLQAWVLRDQTLPTQPLVGLLEVTAFVTALPARKRALSELLLFGWPSLLGLCYGLWCWWRRPAEDARDEAVETVRLALLAFAGAWMAWFALLSVGWPRYLFPATFVASIFTATLLDALTDHFNLRPLVARANAAIRYRRYDRLHGGALLTLLFIAATVPLTLRTVYREYVVETSDGLLQAAHFLNTQTPPGTLVETYEAELHMLLERPYHYPPDQIHVELTRRTYLEQNVPSDYDPLAADPDYLVIGPFGSMWQLYSPVVDAGDFRLVHKYGEYSVYERVGRSSGQLQSRSAAVPDCATKASLCS